MSDAKKHTTNAESNLAKLRLLDTITQNAIADRQALLAKMTGGTVRDYDKLLGYPYQITLEDYVKGYKRGLGKRVVNILPQEAWKENPEVYETEEQIDTPFEELFEKIEKQFQLFQMCQRVDELSGVGQFGALLLGFNDGKKLNVPVTGVPLDGSRVEFVGKEKKPVEPPANPKDLVPRTQQEPTTTTTTPDPNATPAGTAKEPERKLIFVRPLDQSSVRVKATEVNETSPRFGLPMMYEIQQRPLEILGMPVDLQQGEALWTEVHWTRILHVVRNRMTSDVYGTPEQEDVWDQLLDVKKVAGGSGEMFWRGAFPGYSLEMDPNLAAGGQVEIDEETVKDQMFSYTEGLQRYIAMTGMTVKSLAPQLADPSKHFEVLIQIICIIKGIPMRIFMGSEQAQLASSQDKKNWNGRLKKYRDQYLTPYLITPLIERLIQAKVLPQPKEICIEWADLDMPTDLDKATIASTKTDALQKYIAGNVGQVIPPLEFLTVILGMDLDVAQAIMDAAEQQIKDTADTEADTVSHRVVGLSPQAQQEADLAKSEAEAKIAAANAPPAGQTPPGAPQKPKPSK